jgi:hypothetical protein
MKLASVQRWPERHPVLLGLSISGVLLLGLVVQTVLLDRFRLMLTDPVVLMLFRIAIVHCLMAGYFPAAYYALLGGTRETVHELEEILDPTEEAWSVDSAVQVKKRSLLIFCTIGVVVAVVMPYLTSPTPPWDPLTWSPEVGWHRLLGLFGAVWTGCLFAAVVDTAAQTSWLADWIEAVDLLDLSVWSPFVKQGLLTSLLVIGGLSVQALRLYEPGERIVLAITFGISLPLALLGLWLPVRGAHRRIRQAKEAELAWVHERIQQSRARLQEGSAVGSPGSQPGSQPGSLPSRQPDQMPGLIAYLQLIERVPEWPFQTSTFVQVLLYLLIPIASWFGSALVEGLLGRLMG